MNFSNSLKHSSAPKLELPGKLPLGFSIQKIRKQLGQQIAAMGIIGVTTLGCSGNVENAELAEIAARGPDNNGSAGTAGASEGGFAGSNGGEAGQAGFAGTDGKGSGEIVANLNFDGKQDYSGANTCEEQKIGTLFLDNNTKQDNALTDIAFAINTKCLSAFTLIETNSPNPTAVSISPAVENDGKIHFHLNKPLPLPAESSNYLIIKAAPTKCTESVTYTINIPNPEQDIDTASPATKTSVGQITEQTSSGLEMWDFLGADNIKLGGKNLVCYGFNLSHHDLEEAALEMKDLAIKIDLSSFNGLSANEVISNVKLAKLDQFYKFKQTILGSNNLDNQGKAVLNGSWTINQCEDVPVGIVVDITNNQQALGANFNCAALNLPDSFYYTDGSKYNKFENHYNSNFSYYQYLTVKP